MKTMQCADEAGFPVREFSDDGADSTCQHCGWMQHNFSAGLRELVACASWRDEAEKARYLALAEQSEGQ